MTMRDRNTTGRCEVVARQADEQNILSPTLSQGEGV